MKSAMIAASFAAVATGTPPPNKVMLFENFIAKYDKHYASEFEKGQRFQIFSENVDKIYHSNAQNRSYTLGITKNADRTFDEWKAQHLNGFNKPDLRATKGRAVFAAPKAFTPPDSIDWVAKGGVTSVKNQGTCGSCWTFSTVGALEGAAFVAGKPLKDLSMQHILACDTGGNGCGGGSMDQAFGWVEKNGVTFLADEPYLCKDADSSACKDMKCGASQCQKETGETCIFSGCSKVPNSVCNKSGWVHKCECPEDQCLDSETMTCTPDKKKPITLALQPGDVTTYTDVGQTEMALEAAVAQQPVSVAIEADKEVFQHYTSGVLTDDACGSNLDHGVLAVGYGVDPKYGKYWKVKNSWDTTFGEDGYIRIEKGDAASGGECGIRKMASFPTVKKSEEVVV